MTARRSPSPPRIAVVGLTGPRGVGKDTVAELLAVHHEFTPIAFADPLRTEVADAFHIDPALLLARETKETPLPALALDRCADNGFVVAMQNLYRLLEHPLDLGAPRSPRQILRWWGTDYRRVQNPAYWVSRTAVAISVLRRCTGAERFVLTDVRMRNEADLVRQYGGLLWQIARPGHLAEPHAHASETSGAEFGPDTVIDNRHDVRHLQQMVHEAWGGAHIAERP